MVTRSHIKPLQQLGAHVEIENGYVIAEAKQLIGDRIVFDFATFGGTENIMMTLVPSPVADLTDQKLMSGEHGSSAIP